MQTETIQSVHINKAMTNKYALLYSNRFFVCFYRGSSES